MENPRPGGLTALAVVNFVLGGLSILMGLLSLLIYLAFPDVFEEAFASAEAIGDVPPGLLVASLCLSVVVAGLLIVAGIGYLMQKRVLGRRVGNAYAILDIGNAALTMVGGIPFGILTLVGLVYPLLTLFFLNVTFRDDLVR